VARITDAVVRVAATKQVVRADCYGNNAAVECPACLGYPVLLIALRAGRARPPTSLRDAVTVVRKFTLRTT